MILNHVWLRVQVATIDRRMITHSWKVKIFFVWRFFSSRQFRRIVYSFEIIQNLCFSRILKINFTKTCMHACKILQVLPKIKNPQRSSPVWITARLAFPKNHFRLVKNHCEPRAHARAPARTRTRGIYTNIIRRTSIYIFPKGKIYIY